MQTCLQCGTEKDDSGFSLRYGHGAFPVRATRCRGCEDAENPVRAKKRAYARSAWHLRGKQARDRKLLEKAFRRATERADRRKPKELLRLTGAAKTVVKKYHSRQRARLVRTLRRRLENALHGVKIGSKSEAIRKYIGTDLEGLRLHLEGLFKPGMTWENHSYEGWHVDHIKPVSSFDLADPAQLAACFHYTNLQPLWATENLEKGEKRV